MPADRIRQPDSLIEPTYEGRRLPKPHEEVVDQGLQFDLGTLQRRRALKIFGIGIAGTALAACSPGSSGSGSSSSAASQASTLAASSSTASSNLTEIPDETAGPYPGDGSNGADVLEQSGVVRRDIRSSFGTGSATAEGVAMTLKLTILDIAAGGGPMAGAAVYVWHCNRAGEYSMYASAIKNENYLRGVQLTDSNGVVEFTSIFPACYSGRWPHIHFEVYPDEASITDATKAIATSQVALPKSTCDAVYATTGYSQSVKNLSQISLDSDNVFGDDGGVHQIAAVKGDPGSGYTVELTAPVDTRTTPSSGAAPGGGPGGGGPSGPGGPPPGN